MISHVLSLTGQKQLIFIGHSMGTMAFWIMMNARPWMNARVRVLPVCYLAAFPLTARSRNIPLKSGEPGTSTFQM